jgi:hypothetical protein
MMMLYAGVMLLMLQMPSTGTFIVQHNVQQKVRRDVAKNTTHKHHREVLMGNSAKDPHTILPYQHKNTDKDNKPEVSSQLAVAESLSERHASSFHWPKQCVQEPGWCANLAPLKWTSDTFTPHPNCKAWLTTCPCVCHYKPMYVLARGLVRLLFGHRNDRGV